MNPEWLSRCGRHWAGACWARGWHTHALEVADRLIEMMPMDFKARFLRATIYYYSPPPINDKGKALADFKVAYELYPTPEYQQWIRFLESGEGSPPRSPETLLGP